jgi:hypothetical protein
LPTQGGAPSSTITDSRRATQQKKVGGVNQVTEKSWRAFRPTHTHTRYIVHTTIIWRPAAGQQGISDFLAGQEGEGKKEQVWTTKT